MLTLFHDFTSPASAVAVARLQRLADEGTPVDFVGMEAIGVDAMLPVTLDVIADVERLAAEAEDLGLLLRRPTALPPTAAAHAVASAAVTSAQEAAWRWTCYDAFWQDGANLADHEVLKGLGARAGLDADRVRQALDDRPLLAEIRRRTGERRRDGVGGVPTILAQRTLIPGLLPESQLRELAALEG